MSEQKDESLFDTLVEVFLSMRNFDHPDMDDIARIGQQYGVSRIDAGKAFLIAREKASLLEGELLDGGDGFGASNTKNYGDESLHEILFENTAQKRK